MKEWRKEDRKEAKKETKYEVRKEAEEGRKERLLVSTGNVFTVLDRMWNLYF